MLPSATADVRAVVLDVERDRRNAVLRDVPDAPWLAGPDEGGRSLCDEIGHDAELIDETDDGAEVYQCRECLETWEEGRRA